MADFVKLTTTGGYDYTVNVDSVAYVVRNHNKGDRREVWFNDQDTYLYLEPDEGERLERILDKLTIW